MQTMYVKNGKRFRTATPAEIAEVAGHYALQSLNRERPSFDSPRQAVQFLQRIYAGRDYETFTVLFLSARFDLIECVEMFRGTVAMSSVHPREIVKDTLWRGAAALLFAHNHPSGSPEASSADITITNRLTQALALIDVPVVDHLIIGGFGKWSSMKESGLI